MSEASPPLRVVIFAAKSTTDERGSIPQQIAECEAHAVSQGWIVDSVEHDEAASAWSANRGPGLERAMARAEAIAAEDKRAGLVVWKSNRLARGELVNTTDSRHLIDYFRWGDRHAIELHSVTDPATFTSSLVAFVVGEMNAADSKSKSDAVRRATRARRAAGRHGGGFIFGYLPDRERGYVPDPATAPVVRRIFAMVAQGISQAEVARILTAEGVPAPRAGRSGWAQGSLSAMLRRRTYLGEMPTDDPAERAKANRPETWAPGRHEALISRDTWEAVQAANARRSNRKGNAGGRRPKAGHLLTGAMLHHATCGQAMTPRSYERRDGAVTGVYTCSGAKVGACGGLRVPMAAVDEAIIEYLSSVGVDTEKSLRLLRDSTRAQRERALTELDAARVEVADLEEQRARMWADRRGGRLDDDDWQLFKSEHADEAAAAKAKVAQLEARVAQEAVAPVVVPAAAEALALVREFVARGDHGAVRNVAGALFSGFIIGRPGEMGEAPYVSREEAQKARDAVRERIAAMEAEVGRTVAEGNAQADAEDAAMALPEHAPADDPLTDGLSVDGLILLPEPRQEALASVSRPDGPALLVDAHGRSIFRRLPLQSTYGDGFTR